MAETTCKLTLWLGFPDPQEMDSTPSISQQNVGSTNLIHWIGLPISGYLGHSEQHATCWRRTELHELHSLAGFLESFQ